MQKQIILREPEVNTYQADELTVDTGFTTYLVAGASPLRKPSPRQ
jgi:predicted aspartyl protease